MYNLDQIVSGWIEAGIAAGEFVDVPANACASILLALGDGLLLHAGLDPAAFRWENIRRVLDVLLAQERHAAPAQWTGTCGAAGGGQPS